MDEKGAYDDLAVLMSMWRFQCGGYEAVLEYVDNFFDIMPAGTLMAQRGRQVEAWFAEVDRLPTARGAARNDV